MGENGGRNEDQGREEIGRNEAERGRKTKTTKTIGRVGKGRKKEKGIGRKAQTRRIGKTGADKRGRKAKTTKTIGGVGKGRKEEKGIGRKAQTRRIGKTGTDKKGGRKS